MFFFSLETKKTNETVFEVRRKVANQMEPKEDE